MKKCRQCGMLSADTAVVCRHCNAKFSDEDKPITATPIKKKRIILSIVTIAVAVVGIALFVLYQTGMLKTWLQEADKNKITVIAEEFVKADFEKDAEKVKSYMFDQYITVNENEDVFSLQDDNYTSFYFALNIPDSSMQILSVDTTFLIGEDFELFYNEISQRYSVTPKEIVTVEVTIQITGHAGTMSPTAFMTFVKLDKSWYVLPIL